MYSECMLSPYVDHQLDDFFAESDRTTEGSDVLRNVGTHPNAKGLEIMARRVVAGIRSIVGF